MPLHPTCRAKTENVMIAMSPIARSTRVAPKIAARRSLSRIRYPILTASPLKKPSPPTRAALKNQPMKPIWMTLRRPTSTPRLLRRSQYRIWLSPIRARHIDAPAAIHGQPPGPIAICPMRSLPELRRYATAPALIATLTHKMRTRFFKSRGPLTHNGLTHRRLPSPRNGHRAPAPLHCARAGPATRACSGRTWRRLPARFFWFPK